MNKRTSNTEIEVKVLDFDCEKVVQRLRELRAVETPEILFKRWVLDFSTEEYASWFRLRTDGVKTHLTFKKKPRKNLSVGKVGQTEEVEVEVADFDLTYQILSQVSFDHVYYQENKRHKFELDGIEFCIDTWPGLAPYLEIEADSEKKVQKGLKLLGLEGKSVGDKDIKVIYEENGISIHSFKELKFELFLKH